MFATFPVLYQQTYGFSTGLAGLVSLLTFLIMLSVSLTHIFRRISARESALSYRHSMVHMSQMPYTVGYAPLPVYEVDD